MNSKSILKYYIRKVLSEAAINLEDHDMIEDTMQTLESELRSRGLDLHNLPFDAQKIVFLRDGSAIKDENATKPQTVGKNPFRKASRRESQFDMSMTATADNTPALGFNPMKILSSSKPYYVNKIKQLKDFYESHGNMFATQFLQSILSFKEAVDASGLKVLGSGIFRVAIAIPGNDNIVVKIALSEKGRKDNESEIKFSMGGTFKQSHIDNFPTIFTHDNKSYAWYAVEKVKFLSDGALSQSDILSDIKSQFSYTYKFFEDTGLNNYMNDDMLFYHFFAHMFSFTPGEINQAHQRYNQKVQDLRDTDYKNKSFYEKAMLKIKKIFSKDNIEPKTSKELMGQDYESPEVVVIDDVFVKRFQTFMFYVVDAIIKRLGTQNKNVTALVRWIDAIAKLDKSLVRLVSNEIKPLLDQAVMTDMKDLHAGNIGFKHDNNGRWRLIFTDMDSNT